MRHAANAVTTFVQTPASILKKSVHVGLFAAGLAAVPLQANADLTWRQGPLELSPSARIDLDQAFPRSDVEHLDNDFLIRRARIGVDGKFGKDWNFEAGYDFTDDGEFKDVNIEYQGFSVGDITVGQFKVPFGGLDQMTSSRNILFIERSLPVDAFRLSRRLGVGFENKGAHYTFSVMGFGGSIDEDDGHGAAARLTYAPINANGKLLHFGAAIATESAYHDKAKINADPEAKPVDEHLVSTGTLRDANRINRAGLEMAWQGGPFTVQGQWLVADVTRSGQPNALLNGWTVSGSWLLNGGHRPYDGGKFKGIVLEHPYKTWEVTARYSHLNLNDGPVDGGKESNFTVGLNWYIADHGRVMLNYIKAVSKKNGVSDDPGIFLARLQLWL